MQSDKHTRGWRIMRYARFLMVLPLLALLGCDDDGITENPVDSAALVRFINLSEDPGVVDVRFIDRVENLPTFAGVPFEGTTGAGFRRVADGTRHLRIFPNSTNPTVAQTQLVDDPSFGLSADQRYSLVLTGSTGDHTLTQIQEPATLDLAPDGQISVQVLHGDVGQGAVRVHVSPSTEVTFLSDLISEAVHVFDVGELSTSGYANLPVLDDAFYYFAVTDGDDDLLYYGAPQVPGSESSTPTVGPLPGVTIEGSVLTAILTPAQGVLLTVDRTIDP